MESGGGAAHRRWSSFRTSVNSAEDISVGGEGMVGPPQWDESPPSSSPPQNTLEMTSASSAGDIIGVASEGVGLESPTPASFLELEDSRVFVALPEEVKHGKSTLLWALENLAKDGARVVIAHVHRPADKIPTSTFGAKIPYTRVNPQRISDYRKKVRAEVEKKLDEYVKMCTRQKVSSEILIIDNKNVAEGIEELINLHGITKLVMGAAADKHNSKKMESLKSKTALRLFETAASSCKIWFTCKGYLICTREANTTAFTGASTSSVTRVGSHLKSVTIVRSESEASSLNGSPGLELRGLRREEAETSMSSIDSWISQNTGYAPSGNDDAVTVPFPSHELESLCVDGSIFNQFNRLEEALREAEKQAYKESAARLRAERDKFSALQKAKEIEKLYEDEIRKREALEKSLARGEQEIGEMEKQREVTSNELLELKSAIKENEEKMAAFETLIQMLQTDKKKLQEERDAAVTEAEGLRQKNDHEIPKPLPAQALNTEFSYSELKQAAQGFSKVLNIGEDAFRSVYKVFLRNTTVAIKLLNPMSMQEQSEFNQEVSVLGRVRHPNLVTLIGVCQDQEALGLVYEFPLHGSLEDRLACTNNTPPLAWQVRTKIICEICSDLKLGNILLDANFVSKIGGFGRGTTTTNGNGVASNGELTPRSDVCSFGIIILQLLTGQTPPLNIAALVEGAMERDELHTFLDRAAGDWPFVQANQLAHIGLRCLEEMSGGQQPPDLAGEVWKVVEPLMKAASLKTMRLWLSPSLDEYDNHTPSYFVCPIILEVMHDPHITVDGFTYEGEAIAGWFGSGRDTSPMTNLKLEDLQLIPNRALRSAIRERQQQGNHFGSARAGPSLSG